MKKILTLFAIAAAMTATAQTKSFYDFKIQTIDGEEFDFAKLKGSKVMIVNTASKCGYTPQYEKLEKLYKARGGKDFIIIGFPANNFGGQEPGSNKEIAEFCQKNYGVSFLMASKVSVKGSDIHPVYQWLTQKAQNGVADAKVAWNFQKFLIDENGKWVKSLSSNVDPMSDEIISWLGK